MGVVEIGSRVIEYDVRWSDRARRKRIEVTPGAVEVIVPRGSDPDEIQTFVESKRRWLVDKTDEVREEVARLRARTPEGVHSGAKILFRGRFLRLRVEPTDVSEPDVTYRTAFHVRVPRRMKAAERDAAVTRLLTGWMDERLEEDAWEVIRRRGRRFGLEPKDVRIKEQRTLWGSCGRDRILRLDRKLSRVPKPVFEYVVVHELCHLEHRDHSDAFWSLVKQVLPDYPERRSWLEAHGVKVG
jgi:predicted metal-dependent hydrolase